MTIRSRLIHTENNLDKLDLSIARELKLDARQSGRKIAAKLGVSGTTVSKRLKRMVEANILSFCCIADPVLMGLQSRTLFRLKIKPGKEDEVALTLERHNSVQNVNLVTGRYNIIAFAFFRDHHRQLRWMTNELSAMENVLDYEEIHLLELVKNSWGQIDSEIVLPADAKPLDFSESELNLIRALEANPREDIESLAKKIGMNRKTAAKKLQELLEKDIVRVVSITDPIAMGYSVHAMIFLKARLDRFASVINILKTHERITHVAILGGVYNILIAAAFRRLGEMSRFLRSELGEMAGVVDREIMIHIEPPMWSYRLVKALDYE